MPLDPHERVAPEHTALALHDAHTTTVRRRSHMVDRTHQMCISGAHSGRAA